MAIPPIVVNDHSRIQSVYDESEKYLQEHTDLRDGIAAHLLAYNEVQDLIPFEAYKLGSGHLFPYSESRYELESSFELCKQGFYRHSFFTLRSVLELGILGLHFDNNGQPDPLLGKWLNSKADTPRFEKEMLKSLFESEYFRQVDARFSLREETAELYDRLSNHAHIRGYDFSSRRHSRGDANRFNKSSLGEYVELMSQVVRVVITMMLLKYPVGMQSLPVWDMFRPNPPEAGWLEEDTHRRVVAPLPEDVKDALQQISDNDPGVKATLEYFAPFLRTCE
jgi:hypothetical protein